MNPIPTNRRAASATAIAQSAPPPAPDTLLGSLRALPAPVWVLFVGMFVNKFGTFVIPFLTLYLKNRGFGLADAGLALGAYGVGNFAASGVGGWLADRIGRRKTIAISMFGGAATMLALSQANSLTSLVALGALTGFCSELYRPASSALIIDLVPPEHRVTAFAAYRLSFNAGWAVGPAVAGLLAKHSYFYLFLGDAITSAIYGVIAWFLLPKGVRLHSATFGWAPALRAIRGDAVFLSMLAAYLVIGFLFFQMASSYSVFVTDAGFSEATYGLLIGLNGVLVVILELPLTRITRRFRPASVMSFGFALVGLGLAMNALPPSWIAAAGQSIAPAASPSAVFLAWLVAAMIVFTLGEIISMPVSSAFVSELAPADMRGRYMGVIGFTWSLAFIIGPVAGLSLYHAGPAVLWLTCGTLGAIAAIRIRSLNGKS